MYLHFPLKKCNSLKITSDVILKYVLSPHIKGIEYSASLLLLSGRDKATEITNYPSCFRSGVSADASHSSQFPRQWLRGQPEPRPRPPQPVLPHLPHQPCSIPGQPEGVSSRSFLPVQLPSAHRSSCKYRTNLRHSIHHLTWTFLMCVLFINRTQYLACWRLDFF